MKEKILNKLTELFISKNKVLTPEVAKVWVTKLCGRFSENLICPAIETMIWSSDDFPTLGKIAKEIENHICLLADEGWCDRDMNKDIFEKISNEYKTSIIDITSSYGVDGSKFRSAFKKYFREKINDNIENHIKLE